MAQIGQAINSGTGEEARRGQDRTGQDKTGQDRTGQDRTGQERRGEERRGEEEGEMLVGVRSYSQSLLRTIRFWGPQSA